MRSSRRLTRIALAVLLCFTASYVGEGFLHTDDGCAVEIHCSSCRWASTVNGVVVYLPLPASVLERVETVPPAPLRAPHEPSSDDPSPRGPPA